MGWKERIHAWQDLRLGMSGPLLVLDFLISASVITSIEDNNLEIRITLL